MRPRTRDALHARRSPASDRWQMGRSAVAARMALTTFTVVGVAMAVATPARQARAADQPAIIHTKLLEYELSETQERAIVWDTRYAPGAINPRHAHAAA